MKKILQEKITNMSTEEVLNGMYQDTLTKIWNRRAFEQVERTEFVAIVDLDSLKWINDNEGHRAGDTALQELAANLNKSFPDRVFRLSGDEFVVISNYRDELKRKLGKGLNFSYGVGRNVEAADEDLRKKKEHRTKTGQRAVRGEMPTYMQKALNI